MAAALSRPNPLAPIGHAGKSAPTLADERIAISDLPKFAATPTAAANGFRAALIQRDADSARAANRELRDALAAVLAEVDGPGRPYSTDSYLPHHIVVQARRALTLGGTL